MADPAPLAELLCDLFPTSERSRWPFSVQLAAARLTDAGVTVAANPSDAPAPLRRPDDNWTTEGDLIVWYDSDGEGVLVGVCASPQDAEDIVAAHLAALAAHLAEAAPTLNVFECGQCWDAIHAHHPDLPRLADAPTLDPAS